MIVDWRCAFATSARIASKPVANSSSSVGSAYVRFAVFSAADSKRSTKRVGRCLPYFAVIALTS